MTATKVTRWITVLGFTNLIFGCISLYMGMNEVALMSFGCSLFNWVSVFCLRYV